MPRMSFHRVSRRDMALIAAAVLATLALTACSNSEKASTETAPTGTAESKPETATAVAGHALSGHTFTATEVTEVTGHTLVDGSSLTLAFEGDRVAVQAGCNNMNSDYTYDGTTLEVPLLASTMMACEPALMEQDQWVSDFLAATPDADLSGTTLTLTSGDTTVVLTEG